MNDFKAEPEELHRSMVAAAERVIASGWYVLGREVEQFEKEWANACGTGYAVGVGNGLDAIEISLRAMGVGIGDEVITTPMTAFATVLAIIRAGAVPVLADIDPDTALLSTDSVRRCISKKTKAIVLVHLYGHMRNMKEWSDLCSETGIGLVEDCAQAHLAEYKGKFAGSFGSMGAFSFYPTKNLGAPGDAGAITTNDLHLRDIASRLRNYGQSVRYHHPESGMNSRLDELQAAILSERLKWLAEFNSIRKRIALRYFSRINNENIHLMSPPEEPDSHVFHLFVVRCRMRDKLQKFLTERNIQTLIHYPVPAHHQKPLSGIKRDPAGLTESEKHADTCLSIPCHPQMSDDSVESVIAALNDFRI